MTGWGAKAKIRRVDPITLVVTAVALGASAGLSDTASAVIKDAYRGLKRLLAARYGQVDVAPVEARPESEPKRASLDEELRDAGAGNDVELLAAAQQVVEAVAAHDQAAGPALGVDLVRVKAEFLRVRSVQSEGAGVRVADGQFTGGIGLPVPSRSAAPPRGNRPEGCPSTGAVVTGAPRRSSPRR